MTLGYKLDLLAGLFQILAIFLYCRLRSVNLRLVSKCIWENGKELNLLAMKTFILSLEVEVSQIDDWLVFLKCFLFLERSDSFLAVFIPFIISALRWNLCLNGKASAKEIQHNGKSCYTMFQCESFLWLIVNVRDFFPPH